MCPHHTDTQPRQSSQHSAGQQLPTQQSGRQSTAQQPGRQSTTLQPGHQSTTQQSERQSGTQLTGQQEGTRGQQTEARANSSQQSREYQASNRRTGEQPTADRQSEQFAGQPSGQQASRSQGQQSATQQPATAPVFQTANFLPEDVRSTSAEVCNRVLADAVVVVSQLEAAHWNVRGPDFYQLHELFDDLVESLEPHVDEIAERVTALGGISRGTVYQAAQQSTLPPLPDQAVEGRELLQHVAQALSAFDATLYQGMETVEQVDDLDTVDLLNEVSRDVSKSLWFVEAHLQGEQARQIESGRRSQGQSLGQ